MKYISELPWRSIFIISTGMIAHISNTCVLGFCRDKLIEAFTPSFSSIMFTFTVCSLLSRYNLNPKILKSTTNARVLLILEGLWTLLLANIALRIIWIPQVINMADILDKTAEYMNNNYVTKDILPFLSEYITFDNAVELANLVLALWWFAIYIYAVNGVNQIKRFLKKIFRRGKSVNADERDEHILRICSRVQPRQCGDLLTAVDPATP